MESRMTLGRSNLGNCIGTYLQKLSAETGMGWRSREGQGVDATSDMLQLRCLRCMSLGHQWSLMLRESFKSKVTVRRYNEGDKRQSTPGNKHLKKY